jgi:hypothetical protein
LCSQATVSRWENAPGLREAARPMRVMVALYCASYAPHLPPALSDVVHGHQQLSLFNAHYDERCFLCQGASHFARSWPFDHARHLANRHEGHLLSVGLNDCRRFMILLDISMDS